MSLGYRCVNSGMTMAASYRHEVETDCECEIETSVGHDLAKTVFTFDAHEGQTIRLVKYVAYHSSRAFRRRSSPTAVTARSNVHATPVATRSTPNSTSGSTSSGRAATSRSSATRPPNRPSG
ncbi:MAG: hypothetical protein R2697_17945 [Ilumatobacteraceae bacterium]